MGIDLKALAASVAGRLDGPGDVMVTGVASVQDAQPGDVTFIAHKRYLSDLARTRASAVILGENVKTSLPAIRVVNPYLAFLKAIEAFARPVAEVFPEGIHPTACIDPSARIEEGVRVGPHVCIDRDCHVGAHTILGAGTVLMRDVRVGSRCLVYPQVTVREDCYIGDRVILHAGVVIGSDGFGFAKGEGIYHKIPQIGHVIIEDDVEIGANSCVDRATTGRTVISAGTKLDNLVQIAHNVSVGRHCVISAQAGVSGSTTVGDDVAIAGQVGVVGHIDIGDRVQIAGKSGVHNSIPAGRQVSGIPARDHRDWRRVIVHIGRLERYAAEIADLKQRLEELEKASRASAAADS
jgi:UDP-3-O-[3-hydroxymyristoyl] glucosamine N-acyltransferase